MFFSLIPNKNEIKISEYYDQPSENVQDLEEIDSEIEQNTTAELETGVPNPSKYNQYLINKYSFPKAFS